MSMSMETMTGDLSPKATEAPRCRFCGSPLPIVHNPFTGEPIAYGVCSCEKSKAKMQGKRIKQQVRAEEAREMQRLTKANIPRKFWQAIERVRELTTYEIPVEKGKGLYIFGGVGTGKTETACAIARRALRQHRRVLYLNEPLFLGELKGIYAAKREDMSAEEKIEQASKAEVLIIDDMGKTKPTTFAVETLYRIIEYRYANELTTIVTSNHTIAQLGKELAKLGEADKAQAITSRLQEMTKTIHTGRYDHRTHSQNAIETTR